MSFASTFAFLMVATALGRVAAKTKSVGVTGTVMCDKKPISDAEIELYDERHTESPSVPIAMTKTDAQGRFLIKGSSKRDMFEPKFTIRHSCRAEPCTRRVLLRIPEKYSTSGSKPHEMYDVGVVDMKIKFPTETKTCPT